MTFLINQMMKIQMKGGFDSDDESNISRLVGGRVQEELVQVSTTSSDSVFIVMLLCMCLYNIYRRIYIFW